MATEATLLLELSDIISSPLFSVGPTVRIASVHRLYYGCALSGLRFARGLFTTGRSPHTLLGLTAEKSFSLR
jgi:hypothetical protein